MENVQNGGNWGQNGNNADTTGGWHIGEVGASRFDWATSNVLTSVDATAGATNGSTYPVASAPHDLMYHRQQQNYSLYAGDGSTLHTDPHLVCLNLGKRNYFEDATVVERHVIDFSSVGKRVKPDSKNRGAGDSTAVARCQVEGCHVALLKAKDYHKRHKVCEMHSKAANVVVEGLEQRFCQQCSRFHVVTEFDESKRSCRRRLAGHNERRRKTPNDSLLRNTSKDKFGSGSGRFSFIMSPQAAGGACSLLSSSKSNQPNSWDLSTRSSAALRELIAESRSAMLARQLFFNKDSQLTLMDQNQDMSQSWLQPHPGYQQYQLLPAEAEPYRHVTLDLMQAPSSAFGIFSSKAKREGDEEADVEEDEERGTTHEYENFQYFDY